MAYLPASVLPPATERDCERQKLATTEWKEAEYQRKIEKDVRQDGVVVVE